MDQFSWSISVDKVDKMKLWYELWSKAGANPNSRVDNPEVYVLGFNWFSHWVKNYFFTKVTDSLLIIFIISFIIFILFKSKNKKKKLFRPKISIFLFFNINFIF